MVSVMVGCFLNLGMSDIGKHKKMLPGSFKQFSGLLYGYSNQIKNFQNVSGWLCKI